MSMLTNETNKQREQVREALVKIVLAPKALGIPSCDRISAAELLLNDIHAESYE